MLPGSRVVFFRECVRWLVWVSAIRWDGLCVLPGVGVKSVSGCVGEVACDGACCLRGLVWGLCVGARAGPGCVF